MLVMEDINGINEIYNKDFDQNADWLIYECSLNPDGKPYMEFEEDDGREPGFFFSVTGIDSQQDR